MPPQRRDAPVADPCCNLVARESTDGHRDCEQHIADATLAGGREAGTRNEKSAPVQHRTFRQECRCCPACEQQDDTARLDEEWPFHFALRACQKARPSEGHGDRHGRSGCKRAGERIDTPGK